MQEVILKFPFGNAGREITIPMPERAKILSFQMRFGIPTLWAICDFSKTESSPVERRFVVFLTGEVIDAAVGKRRSYVGTFQVESSVWHLFEEVAY